MQAVCGSQQIQYQGEVLDLGKPFRRATMHELVHEGLGQSPCWHAFDELYMVQLEFRAIHDWLLSCAVFSNG